MKWGDFKKYVEDQGIKDDTEIDWIDIGNSLPVNVEFENPEDDDKGSVTIT